MCKTKLSKEAHCREVQNIKKNKNFSVEYKDKVPWMIRFILWVNKNSPAGLDTESKHIYYVFHLNKLWYTETYRAKGRSG
jgi:hypothetical protein